MRQKSTVSEPLPGGGASGYAGVGPSEVPFVEGSDGPRCTVKPRNTHLVLYCDSLSDDHSCCIVCNMAFQAHPRLSVFAVRPGDKTSQKYAQGRGVRFQSYSDT